jgi:hypothetical protein
MDPSYPQGACVAVLKNPVICIDDNRIHSFIHHKHCGCQNFVTKKSQHKADFFHIGEQLVRQGCSYNYDQSTTTLLY